MTNTDSNPRANRFRMPLQVYCSFGRTEGVASLANISHSGALLEGTEMRPEVGTPIDLYLHLKPPSKPLELFGVVIRHSSYGFGVVFEDKLDPDLRRMVEDAAAVVATRR